MRGELLGAIDLEIVRCQPDAALAAGGSRRRRVLVADHGVGQRAAQVEMERVAELVGLCGLLTFTATPLPIDAVTAECVALQAGEQVVEDLLADLPRPARGQLEPLAVARQVAGFLEAPGEVVEGVEVASRVVAHELADLVAVDRGEITGRFDVHQRVLEALHGLHPGDLGQGAIE